MGRIFGLFSSFTGISSTEDFIHAVRSFSLKQKLVWWGLLIVFIGAGAYASLKANSLFLHEMPAHGGTITEGIIGIPRFINPLLAVSDADRDLAALVYSGLLRRNEDGELVPDLAEKYEITEDGLTYTITLKNDLTWHDGTPLTTEDVEFTILRAQDSAIKSPRRAAWEGVTLEKMSPAVIRMHLRQPFGGFLENLTLGIMPKHIWKGITPDLFALSAHNSSPIGSGPYRIEGITNNSSGIPSTYTLRAFEKFALGTPYIDSIKVVFLPSEETLANALKEGLVEAAGALSTESVEKFKDRNMRLERSTLPRVFGIFFNQNQAPIFADAALREALILAIDKDAIVEEVLHGYGQTVDGPIPPGSLGYEAGEEVATSSAARIARAQTLIEKEGWEKNSETGIYERIGADKKTVTQLSFSLSTADIPELKNAAEKAVENWNTLGVKVELKVFETGDLNQNIIRPRKYEALLFGEIVGHEPDLFSFWHSSQRNDPGLNIALYTNSSVDKLIGEIRSTVDREKRTELYTKTSATIEKDFPAAFLYSPEFIYILPRHIKKAEMASIVTGSERFSNIYQWYIETDNVWNIFLK